MARTFTAELGTWQDSTERKKDGGFRKAWVRGLAGDDTRLDVIAHTEGRADTHVVSLRVGTAEQRAEALAVLALLTPDVIAAVGAALTPAPAPAPAPASSACAPAHAKSAELGAKFCPTCGEKLAAPASAPAPATTRESVIANAKAAVAQTRKARGARTSNPAPATATADQYNPATLAELIGG